MNTDKTNGMIFNKAGRLSKDTFKYSDTNLQTVDKVIYLGMVFVLSGIFSTAQRRQAQKANQALFMIKKGLLSDRKYTITPLTALKLFDAYVKPILVYNSALCAPTGVRNKNCSNPHTINLGNPVSTEKILHTFCKYILGVSSRTSNIASCIELGRYPIEIDIKCHLINIGSLLNLSQIPIS